MNLSFKIIFLLTVTLIVTNSFGQTTADKKKLLVGKWKETKRDTTIKSKRPDTYCKEKYYCYVHEFTETQKYLETNGGTPVTSEFGSWKFKGDSLILTFDRGGRVGYKIDKLTADILILSVWEVGIKKFAWEKPGYIFFKKIP